MTLRLNLHCNPTVVRASPVGAQAARMMPAWTLLDAVSMVAILSMHFFTFASLTLMLAQIQLLWVPYTADRSVTREKSTVFVSGK